MAAKPTLVQLILNATAAGKSMLLAANAAAQKVLLSLGNVDNTSDANKPVSTAQQTALDAKLNLTGGTLTGDLKFTDATYDIGKTGATRPRDGFFSRNVTIGGITTANADIELASAAAVHAGLNWFNYGMGTATYLAGTAYFRHSSSGTANATINGNTGAITAIDLAASGVICAGTYTVATLPSAASSTYKFANVSDSLAPAIGSTVAAGGSAKAMVYSNGTNWTVCAI